jgi:hypothetical protein
MLKGRSETPFSGVLFRVSGKRNGGAGTDGLFFTEFAKKPVEKGNKKRYALDADENGGRTGTEGDGLCVRHGY